MPLKAYQYFLIFLLSSFICVSLALFYPKRDHLGAITLNSDKNWYMNFRRANGLLFQDKDILYHHIGKSIENAKKADIVILGHSMALFGLDWRLLEKFAGQHHLRIFNLSSASDASGEFVLRIIEKYKIHPKLWIINADDHENSFFRNFIQNGAPGLAADVISYSDIHALKNVISRNIQWELEFFLRWLLPTRLVQFFYEDQTNYYTYRSAKHGNWNNMFWSGYSADNPEIVNTREPNCHAAPEEYQWAKKYIQRLKSGQVILTLIPHSRSCRMRVMELAQSLNIPFIDIDWRGFTSFDKGGHLDQRGAERFTRMLLSKLETTLVFKNLKKKKGSNIISNQHDTKVVV